MREQTKEKGEDDRLMEDVLISVIIPAYNIKDYIARCLDSVLAQTYRNLEIIIIDDGSTDGTASILDKYAGKDVRINVIHKKNGGVSSARICGIEKASGDYIGFVDGDDYIEPKMFEHLLNNAWEYDADISHCGYQVISLDGQTDLYYGSGRLIEQSHADGLRDFLKGEFIEPSLGNKLYKRSIVEACQKSRLWNASIKVNEDVLMNYIFFSKAQKSIYEDIPFYHYIQRKGSASHSKTELCYIHDPQKVAKSILDDVRTNEALYPIAYERYLRSLLYAVQQTVWKEESEKARGILKKEIPQASKAKGLSVKVKCMAFGAAYLRSGYLLVRRIYDSSRGIHHSHSCGK